MAVMFAYIGFAILLNFVSSSKLKSQTQSELFSNMELNDFESIYFLNTEDVNENAISQHFEVAFSIGTPAVNVVALIDQAYVGMAVLIADSAHSSYYNYSASSTLTDFQSNSKFWDSSNCYSGHEEIVFNGYTLKSQEIYLINSSSSDNYEYSIIGLGLDSTLDNI